MLVNIVQLFRQYLATMLLILTALFCSYSPKCFAAIATQRLQLVATALASTTIFLNDFIVDFANSLLDQEYLDFTI